VSRFPLDCLCAHNKQVDKFVTMADASTPGDEAEEHNGDNTDEVLSELSAGDKTLPTCSTIGGVERGNAPESESLMETLDDTVTTTTGDDCVDLDADSKTAKIATDVDTTTDSAVPVASLKPSDSMALLRRSPHNIPTALIGAIRVENNPIRDNDDGSDAMEDDSIEEVSTPLEAYLAEPTAVQTAHSNLSLTPSPNNEILADSATDTNVRCDNKRTLTLAFVGIAALITVVVLGSVCGSGNCRGRSSGSNKSSSLRIDSTEGLYAAVDAYFAQKSGANQSATVSISAQIGAWDVSRISNFSRVRVYLQPIRPSSMVRLGRSFGLGHVSCHDLVRYVCLLFRF
jgi:hypothetical protein